MSKYCRWFTKHEFQPAKAFTLRIVSDMKNPGDTLKEIVEPWTGLICKTCGQRKIEQQKYNVQNAEVTQKAYDWLNETAKRDDLLAQLKVDS